MIIGLKTGVVCLSFRGEKEKKEERERGRERERERERDRERERERELGEVKSCMMTEGKLSAPDADMEIGCQRSRALSLSLPYTAVSKKEDDKFRDVCGTLLLH